MRSLRPDFTRMLAGRLHRGACLHLVSPHGQGRRRTLADLRHQLAAMPMLQANLRDYPHDIKAMLGDLGAQAGLDAISSLDGLLTALPPTPTLLILHNLDELQMGAASGYDDAFFATLNGIRDRAGVALLCVSERIPTSWPLAIEAMVLPPLTPAQVLAEISHRRPSVQASAWAGIATWIADQPAPYTLLEHPDAWPNPP